MATGRRAAFYVLPFCSADRSSKMTPAALRALQIPRFSFLLFSHLVLLSFKNNLATIATALFSAGRTSSSSPPLHERTRRIASPPNYAGERARERERESLRATTELPSTQNAKTLLPFFPFPLGATTRMWRGAHPPPPATPPPPRSSAPPLVPGRARARGRLRPAGEDPRGAQVHANLPSLSFFPPSLLDVDFCSWFFKPSFCPT
jgi:hypothetical protein